MRGRASTTTTQKGVGAELLQIIEQIGRERGIDVEVLVGALEDAITAASRKHQERSQAPGRHGGTSGAEVPRSQENLISRLDRRTGEIHVFARKRVVDRVCDAPTEISLQEAARLNPTATVGGYVDVARSTKGLGRIEAQAAKQVISHKVREAEREIVYRDFRGRIGELINATVKRFERGDVILDLGRSEACLPRRYQSRAELFSQGDRVRAVIVEVNKNAKGPQVVVTRIDPWVLAKLLEMEVPEIYDGSVQLRQTVREPGERAKVAVSSRHRDVDAVGACVGMKGSRVQAIIRELRGEKIDIVQWSEVPETFAAHALNPAKTTRVVRRDDDPGALCAIVEDQQLSLAIGKKGQNVRLAAKLVGCRIDIRSDEQQPGAAGPRRDELPIGNLPGLGPEMLSRLAGAGLRTLGDLLQVPGDLLASHCGSAAEAERLRQRALELMGPAGAGPETEPERQRQAQSVAALPAATSASSSETDLEGRSAARQGRPAQQESA